MLQFKSFFYLLSLSYFPFICGSGGGGNPPPPPKGVDAVVLEATGGSCCYPCPTGCEYKKWQARNLRGDVIVAGTLQEERNENNEGAGTPEHWVATTRPPFQFLIAKGGTINIPNSGCHLRTKGAFCVANIRYRVLTACTEDQGVEGCQNVAIENSDVKNFSCIPSLNYSIFSPEEKAAFSEIYDVLVNSKYRRHAFKNGFEKIFPDCKNTSSTVYKDTLDVSGEKCIRNMNLPSEIDIELTDGPDKYDFLYFKSNNIIKGVITRNMGEGELSFFSKEGYSFIFEVYLKKRQIYKTDILRTILAKNGNLYFSGDFVCFSITEIQSQKIQPPIKKDKKN